MARVALALILAFGVLSTSQGYELRAAKDYVTRLYQKASNLVTRYEPAPDDFARTTSCKDNGMYPDPSNCNRYIKCINFVFYIVPCEHGQHFNIETRRCEAPCSAHCDDTLACECFWDNCPVTDVIGESQTESAVETTDETTVESTEEPTENSPKRVSRRGKLEQFSCTRDGLYPYPYDCAKYIHCYEGRSYVISCSAGQHFDRRSQRCGSPCDARCDSTISDECGWNSKKSHSPKQPFYDFTCVRDGLFHNPEDCGTYVQCSNGQAYVMACPHTLHFSEETERCEAPCDARCDPSIAEPCGWDEATTIFSSSDVCNLPRYKGPCDSYMVRHYYDSSDGKCKKFVFGGCRSNGNNFRTKEECLKACATDERSPQEPTEDSWGFPTDRSPQEPTEDSWGFPTDRSPQEPTYDSRGYSTDSTDRSPQEPTYDSWEYTTDSTDRSPQEPTYDSWRFFKDRSPQEPTEDSWEFSTDRSPQVPTYDSWRFFKDRSPQEPTEDSWGYPTDRSPQEPTEDSWELSTDRSPQEPTYDSWRFFKDRSPQEPTEDSWGYPTDRSPQEPTEDSWGYPTDRSPQEPTEDSWGYSTDRSPQEPTEDSWQYSTEVGTEYSKVRDTFNCIEDGLYIDPEYCGAYIRCANGKPFVKACPKNLHFSPETKRCENRCDAHCDESLACDCEWSECNERAPEIDCEVEPDAGPCYSQLVRFYYDRESGRCRRFYYGGCQGNSNNFGTLSECEEKCQTTMLGGFRCPAYTGKFGHYPDCMSYYECKRGNPTLKRCSKGTAFHHKKAKCVPEHEAVCVYECRDSDAVYPVENDCRRYIDCVNGISKVEKCPRGQAFDPERRDCVSERSVSC